MKELSGSASAEVDALPGQVFAVLADVERYQAWYPDVIHRVEVQERHPDGTVATAEASLSAPGIPLLGDLELCLRVDVEPDRAVTLTRIPDGAHDEERFTVAWTIAPSPGGTELRVALDARLPLPRLIPTGGLGDRVASGFVRAAVQGIEVPAQRA